MTMPSSTKALSLAFLLYLGEKLLSRLLDFLIDLIINLPFPQLPLY
jgi:hypothetical protein